MITNIAYADEVLNGKPRYSSRGRPVRLIASEWQAGVVTAELSCWQS
jgi:uncharacterized protein (DUF433 family)